MTHTTYSHELELFSKSSLLSIIIQPSVYLSPSPRPHGSLHSLTLLPRYQVWGWVPDAPKGQTILADHIQTT